MPAKLHMIVPKSFRRNSEIPECSFCTSLISQGAIGAVHGVRATKAIRTILDLLEGGECRLRFFDKRYVRDYGEASFAETKLRRQESISRTASNCEPFSEVVPNRARDGNPQPCSGENNGENMTRLEREYGQKIHTRTSWLA